ncbi:MAG TPA: HepT-like ribonuclease domain-containing protein [Gemmatimonadota bacterium]|nr:HepT-like ribonuclease domain-containing protein [Gemmatimonadota bacterium]
MSDANFEAVTHELDALESELEAMRVAVDEGEETFTAAPTARQAALRHLDHAMRHLIDSAWSLIEETDWEEPEDNLDAIEILAEEKVIPGRLGVSLMSLAEYAAEYGEEEGWEADAEATGAFERVTEGVDAIAEYLEFVHHFMKEWEA